MIEPWWWRDLRAGAEKHGLLAAFEEADARLRSTMQANRRLRARAGAAAVEVRAAEAQLKIAVDYLIDVASRGCEYDGYALCGLRARCEPCDARGVLNEIEMTGGRRSS